MRRIILRRGTHGALCVLAACSLVTPSDPSATQVFRSITPLVDTIAADGVSRATFDAIFADDTPVGTTVAITTDAGALAGASAASPTSLSLQPGTSEFSFSLVSGVTTGVATIDIKVAGTDRQRTVVLAPALPLTISLKADALHALANGQAVINLTASALRAPGAGRVSAGTRVQLVVSQSGAKAADLSGVAVADTLGVASFRLLTRNAGTYQAIASSGTAADTISIVFDAPPSTSRTQGTRRETGSIW